MVEKFEQPEQRSAQVTESKGVTLADAKLNDLPKSVSGSAADITLVDDSGKPSTRQEQLQEFVDGYAKAGKLYADSVGDERLGRFQDRVGAVYDSDYKTFKEFAALQDKLVAKPPEQPQDVGRDLGKIFADALSRQAQNGRVDLGSPENQNLMGAISGFMIAARSTFAPGSDQQTETAKMVDALETQLQRSKISTAHGIIWGDTKEPGMATYPSSKTYDRHNFAP